MSSLLRGSMVLLLGTAIVGAGMFAPCDEADAAYGFGGPRYWGGGGYAGTYVDQLPPYFSQFPPVYYKHPIIARQYGQSPFPYPACGCRNQVSPMVKPVTIQNPFYQPSKKKEAGKAEDKTTQLGSPTPLVVYNPYVDQPAGNPNRSQVKAVQVVYPAENGSLALKGLPGCSWFDKPGNRK